jgi:hypothetical protein
MFAPPKDDVEKSQRLWGVLDEVEKNPDHWYQGEWHCGTSHCFAGFAELQALKLTPQNKWDDICKATGTKHCYTPINAQIWLGLDTCQRTELFNGSNKIDDLRCHVASFAPHSREELAALNVPPPVEEKKRRIGVKEVCYALAASLLLAFFAL